MVNKYFVFLCLLIAGLMSTSVQADEHPAPSAPGQYRLVLVWVADSKPSECLRTIQGPGASVSFGYQSLYAPTLREFVKNRTDGSVIDWFPGCMRSCGDPTPEEVQDFQEFCKTEGVKFIIHPSG